MIEVMKAQLQKHKGFFTTAGIFRTILTGILVALLFVTQLVPSQAVASGDIPDPTPAFYVLDQADVLSPDTEAMIIQTSKELNQMTKAQVVVVTLTSLNDQPLEDVSLNILRQWKIGDKELNNGLLLLLVPSEHKSRIEVGYGLEGALPDAKTGRIQDEFMLPSFKAGNYDQGLRNGYLQIVGEVANEYEVTLDVQSENNQPQNSQPTNSEMPTWQVLLIAIGVLLLAWLDHRFLNGFIFGMLLSMLLRGGGGRGGGGGSSGGGGSGGGGGSSRGW